jgi:hypothetical protein
MDSSPPPKVVDCKATVYLFLCYAGLLLVPAKGRYRMGVDKADLKPLYPYLLFP